MIRGGFVLCKAAFFIFKTMNIIEDFVDRIILGDCIELLKTIPSNSVDMILCDLPYGTTACTWDSIVPFDIIWQEYNRVCKPNSAIVLFASQPFTSKLVVSNIDNFKHEVIWLKNTPTGMAQAAYAPMKYHESIVVFGSSKGKLRTYNPQKEYREGKGKSCYKYEHYCGESNHVKMDKVKKFYDPDLVNPSSVQLFNTVPNRGGKLHPTQKPVNLCEYLIKTYSNEYEIVLDSCSGSGTTAIACHNLDRGFICVEKDTDFYEKSVSRYITHINES